MTKDELKKRILKAFLIESDEEIEKLNKSLIELEKEPDATTKRELLRTLFRSAHTLKGSSRAVSNEAIESVCHLLEAKFSDIRQDEFTLTRQNFDSLFRIFDELKKMRDELVQTGNVDIQSARQALDILGSFDNANTKETGLDSKNQKKVESADPKENGSISNDLKKLDTNQIRVEASKLDRLLAQSGELQVAWQRLDVWNQLFDTTTNTLTLIIAELTNNNGFKGSEEEKKLEARRLNKSVTEKLQNIRKHIKLERITFRKNSSTIDQSIRSVDREIRTIRMLPFSFACLSLQRTVRDLASETGKELELVICGEDVEIDRSIIESIKDPILHLVRNAVDHGLETREVRDKMDKRSLCTIKVTAEIKASRLEVTVIDNGKGLDKEAIVARCQKNSWLVPKKERELFHLIFLPGFSTAKMITEISGRGVGLDIVKNNIESIHGSIDVSSKLGEGTKFTLSLPLTLTTLRSLLVRCSKQILAFSTSSVEKITRLHPQEIIHAQGKSIYRINDEHCPVVRLHDVLGITIPPVEDSDYLYGVFVVAQKTRVLFLVDEIMMEQELIVKSMGTRLSTIKTVMGGATLPNGEVTLILNSSELIHRVLSGEKASHFGVKKDRKDQLSRKRILLIDDSLSTRSLEESILESAGYDVTVAIDGKQGWEYLLENGTDLIVSDVEMPNMDGIELTKTVRKSSKFKEIPIVLVTSLSKNEEKLKGLEAGASAYLIKSGFNQDDLLETISRLF